jgi:hypothetical protein
MSLKFKLGIEEFPEFLYTFGDPRPILGKFLMSSNKVDCVGFENDQIFNMECKLKSSSDLKEYGRVLKYPISKPYTQMLVKIKRGDMPFVLIPFMMSSKRPCIRKDTSRHIMYVLYNRNTRELERIDIKKYHIKEFKIKHAFEKMKGQLHASLAKRVEKTVFISEHDVTKTFINKFKDVKDKHILYPYFLIAYLKLRLEHPDLKSSQIYTLINKLNKKQIWEFWENFASFRREFDNTSKVKHCQEDKILKYETNRCITKSKQNLDKYSMTTQVKECPSDKHYSVILNRCTRKPVDIDVIVNNLSNVATPNKHTKFAHLGGVKNTLLSIMFVMAKHQNAYFVNPSQMASMSISTLKKKEYAIVWSWDENESTFKLTTPALFWETWNAGMLSSYRFIIAPVSLISNLAGCHANALIFDKSNNELERFDGLGADTHRSFEIDKADIEIQNMFTEQIGKFVPNFKYIKPIDYCPRKKIIFQSKELDEIGFDDLRGNCAVWRTWYIDVRLANPHLTRNQVVKYASKKIDNLGSYNRFIKSYQKYIMDVGLSSQKDVIQKP